MKGVALADLHLGFTAFSREIGGRNARELDVEAAWDRAVENTIAEQPDLVTIAGDVFHHPRVSVHALCAFRNGIRRIVEETDAEIIIEQGNHDAPRSTATCTPIVIPEDYSRVHVVTQPQRICVRGLLGERISVACFPFVALGTEVTYKVEPDPEADVNVLLVHAAVKGDAEGDALPHFYGGLGALDVGREADRWDVVAVGDFHEFRQLHPERLAFYSGSIERTSSNIWPEYSPKGIVAYDTADQSLQFVEHDTRRVASYDLGDFDHTPGVGGAEVNDCLQRFIEGESNIDAIVRFVVDAFPRAERDQIDWALVRELKAKCFHFQLDLRLAKSESVTVRDRREGGHHSIENAARAFFADDRPEVQAVAFRHLGLDDQQDTEDAAPEKVYQLYDKDPAEVAAYYEEAVTGASNSESGGGAA